MTPFLDRVQTPEGTEWVRRGVWTIVVLSLLAFVVRGATRPADPYVATRVPIAGLEEISFTVTDPNGLMAEWCAMLADSQEERARGLMGQTSLGGYDGMVFRYAEPHQATFHMRNTLIPLAVAFFGPDGRFLNAHGMDPCPPDVVDCPTYPAAAPILNAVEVPRGGLGRLGIGPGSSISFSGKPCPS